MGKKRHVRKVVVDRFTQSFGEDGVGIVGRFGGLCGIAAIALYLASLTLYTWSESESLGKGILKDTPFGNISSVKFGLGGYCLGTDMAGFVTVHDKVEDGEEITVTERSTFDVCFRYWEEVNFHDVYANETQTMNGCDAWNTGVLHGINPCKRGITVSSLLGAGILLAIIGDIYSEKCALNGFTLLLSGGLGIGAAVNWGLMATEFNDALGEELEYGIGYRCLCGGCAMALLGGIMSYCDFCLCINDKRKELLEKRSWHNCDGDGIGLSGRFAALIAVCTWGLMLAAVATSDWVETRQLGEPGCFCTSPEITGTENGCVGRATFGLWTYCVEAKVPQYGGDLYPICMKYTDIVSTPGPAPGSHAASLMLNCTEGEVVKNGDERFAEWKLRAKRISSGWFILGSIGAVAFGDIYSEKLLIGALCNVGAGVVGVMVMIIWVSFFQDLSMQTGAMMVLGQSGWFLVIGWMAAFVAGLLYAKDLLNIEQEMIMKTGMKGKDKVVKAYSDGASDYNSSENDSSWASEQGEDESDDGSGHGGHGGHSKGKKKKKGGGHRK